MTFSTERLTATRPQPDDFPDIRALHRDAKVMKTLSVDGNIFSDEEIQARFEKGLEGWERDHIGYWVFRSKEDHRFIGRGGLRPVQIEGTDEVELGYAILSDYWRQGYATEIARASLKIGFEVLGLESIVCFTLPFNKASQGVMEKVGFHYERDIVWATLPHVLYRLARSEWVATQTTP